MTQIDMNAIIAKMKAEQEAEAQKAEEARPKILEMMLQKNVQIIKVYFEGSGDDGCIQNIAVVDSPEDNIWNGNPIRDEYPELYKMIEDYSYTYLNSTGVDWVNDDGGQGHIIFDVKNIPPIFECVVQYNVMSTEIGHETKEVM